MKPGTGNPVPGAYDPHTTTLGAEESTVSPAFVQRLGDYQIREEIARGGMGVVYSAWQISLNRPVALKVLLAGQFAGESNILRFRREAEATANLDHPNLMPIYEIGQYEGRPYFSMKLVGGGSLSQRIELYRNKPKEIALLMEKLARAIHFSHQRGILHRDLKPANILLEADGNPVITDFGLAKWSNERDQGLTQTGAILGTPSYMPPEQARGQKVLSTAVDVYSLGAILFELLTGFMPFRGETVMETLTKVIQDVPPHPETLNPNVDRGLAAIALKCLEKDPGQRYDSAEALANDLQHWTNGEPIAARPLTILEQVWRWFKKHTTAAAVVPLLGIILGIGPTLLYEEVDIPPNMLPGSLTTPVGWYRALQESEIGYALAAVLTLGSLFGVGWLIVRLSRPKSLLSALGFAGLTALISSITWAMLWWPVLTEHAQHGARYQRNQIHPIAESPDNSRWLSETNRATRPARAEKDYLARFLPPEKRQLDNSGWEEDLLELRGQAIRANRIYATYRELEKRALVDVVSTSIWMILSTWVAFYLDRSRPRRWSNLIRYTELLAPILLFIIVLMPVEEGHLGLDRQSEAALIYLAVIGLTAWIGLIRDWNWRQRAAIYMVEAILGVLVALGLT